MKKLLTTTALSLALALSATAALGASSHKKASAEHTAALKKCNEDYATAVRNAKGEKGKEKSATLAAAKKTRKDCTTAAPK